MTVASFRFYAELNIFLAPQWRQLRFSAACARDASVKHMIEALGVPHTEVELILVNAAPVDFSYRIAHGDVISVFPCFSTLELNGLASLREKGENRFIADSHLGKLARDLRMLGFDVLYRNDFADNEIADIALTDQRIVLTRDRDLLIRKSIERGCYLYAKRPAEQLHEVLRRYRLAGEARPLTRCLGCNGLLVAVDKAEIRHRLPGRSGACAERFFTCQGCEQIFWDGTHATRMRARVLELLSTPTVFLCAGT
ncbi:MAG: Mut7-C ubiquitin/RNAse domain-containing protein [Burkholderiales bacterium]|nr:Mut7-C ubiquitin/RNAse domain-containing protein [Burkholderiales bacterium]